VSADWAPTPRLRWVERPLWADATKSVGSMVRVLQQWWAPDVDKYMRGAEGEWRDVGFEEEAK
jgi:hypothetical protein